MVTLDAVLSDVDARIALLTEERTRVVKEHTEELRAIDAKLAMLRKVVGIVRSSKAVTASQLLEALSLAGISVHIS